MSHRFIKTALPVFAILALSACENMYMRPLALPTGYTYLNDEYKSPPSPNATDIGYEYSTEKNAHIVASMKDKAAEMFAQIEAGSDMTGKKIYVYNARSHDAQNAAFDHVLREVISENGYTLAKSAHETGSYNLGYAIREPEDLDSEIDFGDFNDEYRVPFFNKYDEYENMFIDMALLDGQTVLTKIRAAYDLPMYGYKRHGEFYFLKPQLGAKSDDAIAPPAMPPMEQQREVANTSAAPVALHAPDQGYND
tara:strand:- start:104 stop:859 length:756 start_codon:yes stop_codon:yes gene_type:complete